MDIVEDEQELAIVMVDPGIPLLGSQRSVLSRRRICMTNPGRRLFWQNISRIVEGLTFFHDAGVVHGSVDGYSIFARGDDATYFRLGGYESCIHIAEEIGAADGMLSTPRPISFRGDLADVARVAAAVLGIGESGAPALSAIEQKMLARLANPPRFQAYDGHAAIEHLAEVIDELGRLGAGVESEIVLYPGIEALRIDLPSLTSGAIPASDPDAVARFVAEDLSGGEVRGLSSTSTSVRLVTNLAVYTVDIVNPRIGMISEARKRRAHDWTAEAYEINQRVNLARNRAAAEEKVRKLGHGAVQWDALGAGHSNEQRRDDPSAWHALLLLEVFSLLKQEFRTFPIDVLDPPQGRGDLVWVSPRADLARDERLKRFDLPPAAVALRKELNADDGHPDWTVAYTDQLGRPRDRFPEMAFETSEVIGGRQAYGFRSSEPVVPEQHLFLRPLGAGGTELAIRRRLQNIVAARSNTELLRAIDDPATVAMDESLRHVAAPGAPPADLDESKQSAWISIAEGRSISLVVGPPGVGKTYLIGQLIKSILLKNPRARLLISSQNHETLIQIEAELKKCLPSLGKIVIRIEKSDVPEEAALLRASSREMLTEIAAIEAEGPLLPPLREIRQALQPSDIAEKAVAERVLRDTDNLILRSSDVTLATTSSYAIEEMIAAGEQFDWVFVEEAARANGSELIGALLLGNRRVALGDHRQLSPFEASERQKFYDPAFAQELLKDSEARLSAISDLPPELGESLACLMSDRDLLIDVLATAARLEEPFRSIAEREEERSRPERPSSISQILVEQSRMHPAICRVVSNTFYAGALDPTQRVRDRKASVRCSEGFPTSPVVVLNMPSLSTSKRKRFEVRDRKTLANPTEAEAVVAALKQLHPIADAKDVPSLVILAPYTGQVALIERLIGPLIDTAGRLRGFVSPRADGRFVYTSDSFQGSESDVVLATLVRNNVLVGNPALGFLKNPQRLNVLLSRARQKLIIATSLQFLLEAVDGTDPDRAGGHLAFVRKLLCELRKMDNERLGGNADEATIVECDERGSWLR